MWLTWHQKYIIPIFDPKKEIDYKRRRKISKKLRLFNQTFFWWTLVLLIRNTITIIAERYFFYELWRFLEWFFSLVLTFFIVFPIVKKTEKFMSNLSSNLLRLFLQICSIFILLYLLWTWIKKIQVSNQKW
jgi:hypothetical protein